MIPVYFAQKAFILDHGRLLAVRRDSSDPNQPHRWEVPGGRLEADEDLDQHLAREVFEETSLIVSPGAPFCVWKWSIRQPDVNLPKTIVAVGRLCTLFAGELGSAHRVSEDHLDLMEWVPMTQLDRVDWIPNMLPVLQDLKARVEAEGKPKGTGLP